MCAVLFLKNPCDSPHFQIIFPDLPSSKEKFSNLHSNGFLLGIGFLLSGPLFTELYCVSRLSLLKMTFQYSRRL